MYLLLLGTLHVAANTYSQNSGVSLNMHHVSLREVVEELQKVTDYTFLYKNDLLETGDRLNVNVKDREIRDVLNEILSPRGLAFEIDDKVVVIRRQNSVRQQVEGVRIQGKVVDEKQISLPGVTVLVKGTDLGVTTDEQGNFRLYLPESSREVVLVFSFVGMKKKEVSWKGETELKVVMTVEAAEMEEVVVTGIFTRKKESFTGSATTYRDKELKMVGNANIPARNYQSNENVRLMAQQLGAAPHFLYLPALPEGVEEKQLLCSTEVYRQIHQQWEQLDTALVNIGNYPSSPDFASLVRYGSLLQQYRACGSTISMRRGR